MEYGVAGTRQEAGSERQDYARLVHDGLVRAEALGFNLTNALLANYGDTDQGNHHLPEEVLDAACELAATAELDAEFFERPARTVLLLGAADSWVGTERRAAASETYDSTVADERHALVDIVLIAAGAQSGIARAMKQVDETAADRYILADMAAEPIEAEADEYLATLENPELAEQIQELFTAQGEESLLAVQRERLGIPAIAERPFRVRVLMLAQRYDELLDCGYVEPVGRVYCSGEPTPEALLLDEKRAKQKAKAAPLLEAYQTYRERFGEKLSSLAPAWATMMPDGSSVLTLTAPYAYGLLRSWEKGRASERYTGLAWHEFTHGQRPLFMGAHIQLGLALEERRAVWNAEGGGDYVDVRLAIDQLSHITDTDLIAHIAEASRTEDPFSTFLCTTADKLGLRTSLLLAASKPAPYTRSPVRAARFVNLRFLTREGDGSEFDAIIRDTLARRGSAHLRANARAWLAQLLEQGRERYLANVEVSNHSAVGLRHARQHYDEALLDVYGPADPNAWVILT